MKMYDIITKKKRKEELTREEILYFVNGYTNGEIPDYQVSALLMAICLNGMGEEETFALTEAITGSGDVVDLSKFGKLTADKHSTGGVGDKTTLIAAPLAAALGCKVAKMSGRGLGHTGGTIDKLESFPGYKVSLSPCEFEKIVDEVGVCVVGQSGNLAPADKKIYALRDVSATVDSIPLIASSVMGKKLASGAQNIVLDVKYGSGAFMKNAEDAAELAKCMVKIGNAFGRRVSALITDMNTPLGYAIGNTLEVREAIQALSGKGPSDLLEVSLSLAAKMASLSLDIPYPKALDLARGAVEDGSAFKKFKEWLSSQGADITYADNTELFESAKYSYELKAETCGYIEKMNAELIGLSACELGAGRKTKDDKIDCTAGIILAKKTGEYVNLGDTLATFYTSNEKLIDAASKTYLSALKFSNSPKKKEELIYKIIN